MLDAMAIAPLAGLECCVFLALWSPSTAKGINWHEGAIHSSIVHALGSQMLVHLCHVFVGEMGCRRVCTLWSSMSCVVRFRQCVVIGVGDCSHCVCIGIGIGFHDVIGSILVGARSLFCIVMQIAIPFGNSTRLSSVDRGRGRPSHQ